jgi:hypothetical protein
MDAKEFLTTHDVAEFLNLSPYTVREYAKKGIIPARKGGGSWWFVKADLLARLRGKDEGKLGGATLPRHLEHILQQQDEYQKLLELCKDVLPKTWNAYEYCDIPNMKNEIGILNIELDIYDKPKSYKNPKSLGHVRRIIYFNGVGNVKISIHCYPLMGTQTLLHELAHIAVFRLQSFITKSYREDVASEGGSIIEPDGHGEIFLRFLNIFENRAIKKGWSFFVIKDNKIWMKDKSNS